MTKKELAKALTKIANEKFVSLENRSDLERHYSDELDFHDIAVWELKAALEAAYELGRNSR